MFHNRAYKKAYKQEKGRLKAQAEFQKKADNKVAKKVDKIADTRVERQTIGQQPSKKSIKWTLIIGFILLIMLKGCLKGDNDNNNDNTTPTVTEAPSATPTPEPTKPLKEVKKLSKEEYKAQCVDIPWKEVVKDRKTYVGTYLKKDLMVRQIGTDSVTGETVYICGEKKGEDNYVGGTFSVLDRRSDKTRPIELYDKIYVYGQITKIYMTYSSFDPEFEVKYIKFNGKFGE